jgi:hypothetical protein
MYICGRDFTDLIEQAMELSWKGEIKLIVKTGDNNFRKEAEK